MPRTFAASVLYPCTFAQAALGACVCAAHTAIWYKYPNPCSTHVHSIDVLDQRVCAETGMVHVERLLATSQSAPRWIKAVRRRGPCLLYTSPSPRDRG